MSRPITYSFLAAVVLALAGCTPTRDISYDIKDVMPADSASTPGFSITKNITLRISPFFDVRDTVPENTVLFVQGRESDVDGKHSCINSEENYKKRTVAGQVTEMMTEHFRKRNTFKMIADTGAGPCDYYLTGDLRSFYGAQEFSTSAKVGSMFGLIGALATSGAKTKGNVVIEFTNLTIHRTSDGNAKPINNYLATYSGDLRADANCWCIFDNVDDQLKLAIDKFAPIVEQAVAELASEHP
jgi:hypothetical protein